MTLYTTRNIGYDELRNRVQQMRMTDGITIKEIGRQLGYATNTIRNVLYFKPQKPTILIRIFKLLVERYGIVANVLYDYDLNLFVECTEYIMPHPTMYIIALASDKMRNKGNPEDAKSFFETMRDKHNAGNMTTDDIVFCLNII